MSRFTAAGRALAFLAAILPACVVPPVTAADTRVLTGRYTGFTFTEPVACGGAADPAMICFDLLATDTHVDVVINDLLAVHVVGFASWRFADGEPQPLGHFCDAWSSGMPEDYRGAPTKLVISIEPHAFVVACSENPADLPLGGTVTVTVG